MDSISVKYHANQNGFMIRKWVSVADFLRVEEKQIWKGGVSASSGGGKLLVKDWVN